MSARGDGGPMFALGELAALVQEQLPVTLLVVDDGGYGMLRYDQQVLGHPERGVDLVTPDWGALAGSFGIDFAGVADAAALRAQDERIRAHHPPKWLERTSAISATWDLDTIVATIRSDFDRALTDAGN